MCGANGETSSASVFSASRGGGCIAPRCFTRIIIWLMAVLKRIASMSSVTFLIDLCTKRFVAKSYAAGSSVTAPVLTFHTRSRNRATPSIPLVCHGFTASSGPMNIS